MSDAIGEAMDEFEITEFLTNRGLGVLGFAAAGEAYTLPVAFAYDDEQARCIFRFLMPDHSRKREFVADTETASLTVYEWGGPDDWRSVVVRGPLQQLPEAELAEAATLFSDLGAEGALDIFNEPVSAYETGWYELDVSERTGRRGFE